MTVKDLFCRALTLLNYTDSEGNVSGTQNAELFKKAVPTVNLVLADILHIRGEKFCEISSPDDALPVPDDVAARVMPYGVAMHIAQSENDGDNQQIMAITYNRLRGSVPRAHSVRANVLPTVTV